MIKWLQNRMIALAMATSKVEKNALNNDKSMLSDNIGMDISHKKGFLSHDLINGVLSEEVKELRWRMYKVLESSNNHNKIIIGYTKKTDPETGEIYDEPILGDGVDSKYKLNKTKVDDYDSYPLDMLINNTEIVNSISERIKLGEKTTFDRKTEMQFHDLPRYKIEGFLLKTIIRKINEMEYLAEFYFSKYHDGYSPTHALFIKDIEKCYNRKQIDYLFDLKCFGFITTDHDLGVKPNKGFLFNVLNFDKIIEFDGHYVVKYRVNSDYYNYDIFDKYYDDDLGEKYKNNEPRNKDANF